MSARFASLPPRAQATAVAAGLLLVAVIGYFAMVAPKRSTASDLKKQTASVQAQIDSNRSSGFTKALPAVRSAPIFKLAQAMPSEPETANVILQLNQLAENSGISFDKIEPSPSSSPTTAVTTTSATAPFTAQPIQVQFSGSFYNLLAFLQRLRNLVRVENGSLYAAGRLFDVSDISFCSVNGQACPTPPTGVLPKSVFPLVEATLTINAFTPQTASATTTPDATDTTSTTTTGTTTTTTTTTSTPTSAAPSTSGGTS